MPDGGWTRQESAALGFAMGRRTIEHGAELAALFFLAFPNQYTVKPQGTIGKCLIYNSIAFAFLGRVQPRTTDSTSGKLEIGTKRPLDHPAWRASPRQLRGQVKRRKEHWRRPPMLLCMSQLKSYFLVKNILSIPARGPLSSPCNLTSHKLERQRHGKKPRITESSLRKGFTLKSATGSTATRSNFQTTFKIFRCFMKMRCLSWLDKTAALIKDAVFFCSSRTEPL